MASEACSIVSSDARAYDEFLVQTEAEVDAENFHETGLARFAAFDLQFLLTRHRYYFYSEELDVVSPVELCSHTLLIDNGSRHRSYCLLLISHVDTDEEVLRKQSARCDTLPRLQSWVFSPNLYNLEDEIDALLRTSTHMERPMTTGSKS